MKTQANTFRPQDKPSLTGAVKLDFDATTASVPANNFKACIRNANNQIVIQVFGETANQSEANAEIVAKAMNMHKDVISEITTIEFYTSTALKSLDNRSLSEVRGMLEGILEKSQQIIKKVK